MKYLIFGTGDYYQRYKSWLLAEDVTALMDNSADRQGTCMDGIPVVSPEQGVCLDYDMIVILSFYVVEMKRQLIRLGVSPEKIIHFYGLHKLISVKDRERPLHCFGGADKLLESGSEHKVLLLSQDLTLGGPSIALFHAAVVLKRQGFTVVYGTMLDGLLRKRLLDAGIPVVVDENLQIATMQERRWIWKFSMIICNTVNFHVFLSKRKAGIPVIWWLHDAPFFYGGVEMETLRMIDRKDLQVMSVGPVPADAIHAFLPNLAVRNLLYGVRDTVGRQKTSGQTYWNKEAVIFVTIGYIEARKGQDLLLQAVRMLPEEIRGEAVFYIVGQDNSEMAQQLKRVGADLQEFVVTGTMEREQLHALLERADILICPSREDPMPTVAAEAMMHSVACIISDAAGTAAYIHSGEDGFIFQNGNVQMLAEKIGWCVTNKEKLCGMGLNARKIYEKYFSMDVFEKALCTLVRETLDSRREQ